MAKGKQNMEESTASCFGFIGPNQCGILMTGNFLSLTIFFIGYRTGLPNSLVSNRWSDITSTPSYFKAIELVLQQASRVSHFPALGFRMSSSAVAGGLSTQSAVGLVPPEVLIPSWS